MPAPSRGQIKINALQRLTKEHQLYVKELEQYKSQLNNEKSAGTDAYEVKKVRELVNETQNVLPRIQERIENELKQIKEFENDEEVGEKIPHIVSSTEEYLASLQN